MAKARKKESTLTLEEKLAKALVPESEQPYKVPKNWCWVKGLNLFEPMQSKKPEGKYFIYIDIESVDNKTQCIESPKNILVSKAPSRASRELKFGDTVFSMVRPYLRNIAFIDESLSDAIASTGFYVCRPNKAVFNKYNYWMLVSDYVVEGLNRFMKGDNSPSIRRDDIEQFAYPLPPLSEQQRIVERIESLFAKLDEAKEKLQEVLDSFETRKAAILHKAFNGELTAKWREENGISLDSWEKKTLGEMLKVTSGKALTSKNMVSGSIPVYGGNGVTGYHNENNVEADTVVIGRVGFYCGSVHHISEKAWVTDNALIVSFNKQSINTRYLVNLLKYYDLRQNDSSTAQPVISGSKIYPIVVNIAKLKEQERIVEIIDSIFIEEKQLRNIVDDTISKIELLRKSILARAFRGELGTNDENDECAVELLKRVF